MSKKKEVGELLMITYICGLKRNQARLLYNLNTKKTKDELRLDSNR